VLSSILRLDLYVQIYLLTWWRAAAFIWMVLVAFGLVLIVARIILNRSNAWLVRANLITLTATLYICSLVNSPPSSPTTMSATAAKPPARGYRST